MPVLAAMALVAVPVRPAEAATAGEIVFTKRVGFGYDQLALRHSNGNVDILSTGDHSDLYPAVSPNGKKIAFVSSRDDGCQNLWVMNSNGTGERRLTYSTLSVQWSDWYPSWNSSSSQILFQRDKPNGGGTDYQIWKINADGSGLTQVSQNDNDEYWHPSWSPDGSKIAFARDVSGVTKTYTMNTSGTPIVESLVSNQPSGRNN